MVDFQQRGFQAARSLGAQVDLCIGRVGDDESRLSATARWYRELESRDVGITNLPSLTKRYNWKRNPSQSAITRWRQDEMRRRQRARRVSG